MGSLAMYSQTRAPSQVDLDLPAGTEHRGTHPSET
jgi:hypothetical protein